MAETLLALRADCKIRAIGVSNHTAAQHRALEAHLGEPLAARQPELSVTHLDGRPLRRPVFLTRPDTVVSVGDTVAEMTALARPPAGRCGTACART